MPLSLTLSAQTHVACSSLNTSPSLLFTLLFSEEAGDALHALLVDLGQAPLGVAQGLLGLRRGGRCLRFRLRRRRAGRSIEEAREKTSGIKKDG